MEATIVNDKANPIPSSDRILAASQQLRAAIEQQKASQQSTRRSALIQMKELIADARKVGFSHAKIATTLSENGVRVTRRDVAQFCLDELGEIKVKRRRRKSTQSIEVTPSAPTPEQTPALKVGTSKPVRAGFRVAKDDEL